MPSRLANKLLATLGNRGSGGGAHLIPPAHKFDVAPEEHFLHPVHGTYPRLCRLSDGSLLAGFTAFGRNNQRILSIARSVDQGRTFHPHGEVTRSSGDCDNLFLLELPAEGAVLAAFRNHDVADPASNRTPTYFRITVCRSTDGGRSWSFLSQAAEKPAPFGLWEPFLRLAHPRRVPGHHRRHDDPGGGGDGRGGEIQLFFSQEFAADDQDTMVVRSFDGGRSWSSPGVAVTGAGERLRDGMVGVAETWDLRMRSGHRGEAGPPPLPALVMVLETTRKGVFSVEAVVSYDGGRSFGSRQLVYEAKGGKNAGAPQVASFKDGSVAVVFMTDEDVSGESKWPRGAKIKALFSVPPENGVFRWIEPQLVGEAASSWPGILRLEDDAILAVYEFSSSIRGRMLKRLA
ncbi:hypothetical protein VTK26DRAFT_404 [Humicola hyalothermophila]